MTLPGETPFIETWPEPAPWLLRPGLSPAPALPLRDVLCPRLADWIAAAAECKGCPPDYPFAALLAVAGSTIGNARWASPWKGWPEPPILWCMAIGNPSAGKSPGLDAMLSPLRAVERPLRKAAEAALAEWSSADDLAKTREAAWREAVKAAEKKGKPVPDRPLDCESGPAPVVPRLLLNDSTVERLAMIVAQQPRGTLQVRDELAGWLENMERYSAASDRAFWLEGWGGRSYAVERVGRAPLTIDRLSVGVLGGIQPDRLQSLLLRGDDDGLAARFLPFWPDPVPVKRPERAPDDCFMQDVLTRLYGLSMVMDENGDPQPVLIPFDEPAQALLDDWRGTCRELEAGASGLMLSHIGKMPGLAVRLALVLALLDWAANPLKPEPQAITRDHLSRACHLLEGYSLPMAKRAYSAGSQPKAERTALALVALIREQRWSRFTRREVLRLERAGLGRKADLDPALSVLEDCDAIRAIDEPAGPRGGRPTNAFTVNPALLEPLARTAG